MAWVLTSAGMDGEGSGGEVDGTNPVDTDAGRASVGIAPLSEHLSGQNITRSKH